MSREARMISALNADSLSARATNAYYIFPQDQKDLREQVDKALKELKEDGTLTEISKKWYGQDAAPEDDRDIDTYQLFQYRYLFNLHKCKEQSQDETGDHCCDSQFHCDRKIF